MPETVSYQGRAVVSQAVAERSIAAKRQVGKNRVLPIKLKVIEELKKQKVHVFNVGPWPQTVNTGSTGTFYIPACPRDKDYIEMLVANPDNLDKYGNPEMCIRDRVEAAHRLPIVQRGRLLLSVQRQKRAPAQGRE